MTAGPSLGHKNGDTSSRALALHSSPVPPSTSCRTTYTLVHNLDSCLPTRRNLNSGPRRVPRKYHRSRTSTSTRELRRRPGSGALLKKRPSRIMQSPSPLPVTSLLARCSRSRLIYMLRPCRRPRRGIFCFYETGSPRRAACRRTGDTTSTTAGWSRTCSRPTSRPWRPLIEAELRLLK